MCVLSLTPALKWQHCEALQYHKKVIGWVVFDSALAFAKQPSLVKAKPSYKN